MEKPSTTVRQKEKMVERMGVFFEKYGLTPIHGRVFAYLLLAEPPHKDFYEIQEFLKASKSAISNALNKLMDAGKVEYITFSGDRKRYFKVSVDGWMSHSKEQLLEVVTLQNIIGDILEARKGSKYLAFNDDLEKMRHFHEELAGFIEQFIEKWERENE